MVMLAKRSVIGPSPRRPSVFYAFGHGHLGLTQAATTGRLIAALVDTFPSFGGVRYSMHIGWAFLPGTLAATLIASLAMMLTFGYVGTATALRAKAAPMLRNE